MSHCSDHLSWPRLFLVVSLLPRTTSGLIGKAPGIEERQRITQEPLRVLAGPKGTERTL